MKEVEAMSTEEVDEDTFQGALGLGQRFDVVECSFHDVADVQAKECSQQLF